MDYRSMIQQSIDYIEENLRSELTASELAEMAHFSLFHYYRLFRQATGLPVMHYVLRRRLLHAIYAVHQGRGRTDAALDYGFDTYAGFYKAFCREFGSTPSEYLTLCRAKRPYRIDITREEHMTITHKTAARILQNWNLEKEPVADIYYDGTGNRNENALSVGNDYILKFSTDPGKLQKHIRVSSALADVGLLSASPIPTVHGDEFIREGELYFCLTRRIPGTQLSSHRFDPGAGRFVGEIIGQLHLALAEMEDCVSEANLLDTVRSWALPVSRQTLGLSEDFCTDYLKDFSALYPRLPRQIIHRDPNPGNIISSEDQWGFIDFELSERNARIYDPCYAATAILSETFRDDNEPWLDIYRNILLGYDSVAHLTDAEREAIPYMILANQFVCVAWFSGQEKYRDIFETNKRMTHWLISRLEELKHF